MGRSILASLRKGFNQSGAKRSTRFPRGASGTVCPGELSDNSKRALRQLYWPAENIPGATERPLLGCPATGALLHLLFIRRNAAGLATRF
jgi:hypothetical protein